MDPGEAFVFRPSISFGRSYLFFTVLTFAHHIPSPAALPRFPAYSPARSPCPFSLLLRPAHVPYFFPCSCALPLPCLLSLLMHPARPASSPWLYTLTLLPTFSRSAAHTPAARTTTHRTASRSTLPYPDTQRPLHFHPRARTHTRSILYITHSRIRIQHSTYRPTYHLIWAALLLLRPVIRMIRLVK